MTQEKPPTVGSFVTQMKVMLLRGNYAASLTAPSRKQMERGRKIIMDRLGLVRIIDAAERRSLGREWAQLSNEIPLAWSKQGHILAFSPLAQKGEVKEARAQAYRLMERALTGGINDTLLAGAAVDPLPAHVAGFVATQGIDPQSLAVLVYLLSAVEFHNRGNRYKFKRRWTSKIKKKIDAKGIGNQSLVYDMTPSHYEIGDVQITIPGPPKVRIVKHGVSVGQALPGSVMAGLVGRPLSMLVSLPGLEDEEIATTKMIGPKVSHVTLAKKIR